MPTKPYLDCFAFVSLLPPRSENQLRTLANLLPLSTTCYTSLHIVAAGLSTAPGSGQTQGRTTGARLCNSSSQNSHCRLIAVPRTPQLHFLKTLHLSGFFVFIFSATLSTQDDNNRKLAQKCLFPFQRPSSAYITGAFSKQSETAVGLDILQCSNGLDFYSFTKLASLLYRAHVLLNNNPKLQGSACNNLNKWM